MDYSLLVGIHDVDRAADDAAAAVAASAAATDATLSGGEQENGVDEAAAPTPPDSPPAGVAVAPNFALDYDIAYESFAVHSRDGRWRHLFVARVVALGDAPLDLVFPF